MAVVGLSSETLASHKQRFPDHFVNDVPVAAQFLADLFAGRSKGAAFVAEDADEIIGWTGFARFEVPSSGDSHDVLGLIIDLTVAENARRKGVGTALVEALVEHARETGITNLQGDVWLGAPSAGVLSRAGIVPVKTVHERRLAERLPGPPRGKRLTRMAYAFLPVVTILLAAIVFFEIFAR